MLTNNQSIIYHINHWIRRTNKTNEKSLCSTRLALSCSQGVLRLGILDTLPFLRRRAF